MNRMTYGVICFIVGGGVGSLFTWLSVKGYYKKYADEAIADVTEVWDRDEKEIKARRESEYRSEKAEEIHKYVDKVNKYGYSDISRAETARWKESDPDPRLPYIVSPDDFNDNAYAHYERLELTYYRDGVLADNNDDVITIQEAPLSIGSDIFRNLRDHFGEYEEDPDVVYVRNESTFKQYEITRDGRTYAQVIGK